MTPDSNQGRDARRSILFVNNYASQCGVHEFGRNVHDAISRSSKFDFIYAECDSTKALRDALNRAKPEAVIYNYMPETMPWLATGRARVVRSRIGSVQVPQIGIIHSVLQDVCDNAVQSRRLFVMGKQRELANSLFDYYIAPDPTILLKNANVYKHGRPLISNDVAAKTQFDRLTIGTFGFTKSGYGMLIGRVQDEFDDAIINIHIPAATFGDPDGSRAKQDARSCQELVSKPGIQLSVTHEYLDRESLLKYLSKNTVNVFCRDDSGRGLASVIDYALSVDRPIGVSTSRMFRHVLGPEPSINVDTHSIQSIIDRGTGPLDQFKTAWSPEILRWEYDRILSDVLDTRERPIRFSRDRKRRELVKGALRMVGIKSLVPYGVANSWVTDSTKSTFQVAEHAKDSYTPIAAENARLNRILDESARTTYGDAIQFLERAAPDLFARKHPRANIQQAFVFDTVVRLAAAYTDPRILCIGSFEDTAMYGLRSLGMSVEGIDPLENYPLEVFASKPTTVLGSYDILFSTSVIEHVPDDATFLRTVDKLMSPTGAFVMTTDYAENWMPGDPKPGVCARLYNRADLENRIPSLFDDFELSDKSDWSCPEPDFHTADCSYSFASLCGARRAAPGRQHVIA